MSPVNGEFSFSCFDCGTACTTWVLAEMLNFADGHQGHCDGREEPGE